MTSRLMRLCCLCLLVLALPLQGLAAAAWLQGSPLHGGAAAAAMAPAVDTASRASAGVPADALHGAPPPCHGHEASADPHPASAPAAGPGANPATGHDHAGCSACAACCGHGTAPPAALPQAPRLALPAALPAQAIAPAVAPWSADGIERPPRA